MTEYTTQTTSIKFDKNFINSAVLIHHDGRVTIGDDLKPDEAAKKMFNIFKDLWANDAQAAKIRELQSNLSESNELIEHLQDKIKRLEDSVSYWNQRYNDFRV